MTKNKESIFASTGCLSMEEMMDYIHDRLSMRDRNKVERHLQQCEFCEEAMEGFSLLKGKEEKAENIISDINRSLVPAENKIRWMAAASLALAILAGGIVYLNSQLSPDTKQTQVLVKDTLGEIRKSPSLSQNITEKDSLAPVISQQYSEKNQLSLNPPKEVKKDLRKQEISSDAFLSPSDTRISQEEKSVSVDKPVINAGNAAGNVMADTLYTPSPAFQLSESKVEENEKSAVLSKKMEVEKKYSYSNNKKRKNRAITPQYRSAPEDKADKLYDDMENGKAVQKNGINSYNNKNYKEATLILEEVLKSAPDSAEALYYNGLSYFELKNYDKALLNFDKIRKEDAYYEDAEQMKAKIYLAKGNKDQAREVLKQIINRSGKYKTWAEEEMKKLPE